MEDNNFFKWVWRLNGLIILGGVCLIVAVVVYGLMSDLLREKSEEQIITSVADDPEGVEKWVLGYPKQFYSSEYVAIPLVSENDEVKAKRSRGVSFASGDYYGYSGASKNILFVNGKSNSSEWLFSNNNQLIESFNEFPHISVTEKEHDLDVESLIFYEVINKDTNQDGVLTKDDKLNLAVSDTQGHGYKILIENIDRIVTQSMVGESEIVVIYQKAGVGFSLKLGISNFNIISNNELPKVSDT